MTERTTNFWDALCGHASLKSRDAVREALEQGYITRDELPPAARPALSPPSDAALKIANAIEASTGRWAFEDDQGHAHCYGLGITVGFKRPTVWQGSRDNHVQRGNVIFDAKPGTADAIVIREALTKRRERSKQEEADEQRKRVEAASAAQAKRAAEAIEKLARGECLDDPDYGRVNMTPMVKESRRQQMAELYDTYGQTTRF